MRQLRIVALFCVLAALPGCSGCRPDPAFTADPLAGDAPLEVTFTDTSKVLSPFGISWDLYYPITSWAWDFGDGGGSSTQNPVHTYTESGAYTVTLTATNARGASTITKTNLITVAASAPTASFGAAETRGDAPFSASFTDTSDPSGSAITGWSWDFGDGGGSTAQNPTHVYAVPGTYSVSLTVTNALGSDTVTKDDLITVDVGKPRALFTADPESGAAPLTVKFIDISIDGSATIEGWSWKFGDGTTSTAENPTHTYATPGDYNVTLTVTSPLGPSTRTENGFISVLALPTVSFETEVDESDPLTITFIDTSDPGDGDIDRWEWTFDDGASSTEERPTHTYAAAGEYRVRLTVRTDVGSDSRAILITVGS